MKVGDKVKYLVSTGNLNYVTATVAKINPKSVVIHLPLKDGVKVIRAKRENLELVEPEAIDKDQAIKRYLDRLSWRMLKEWQVEGLRCTTHLDMTNLSVSAVFKDAVNSSVILHVKFDYDGTGHFSYQQTYNPQHNNPELAGRYGAALMVVSLNVQSILAEMNAL